MNKNYVSKSFLFGNEDTGMHKEEKVFELVLWLRVNNHWYSNVCALDSQGDLLTSHIMNIINQIFDRMLVKA